MYNEQQQYRRKVLNLDKITARQNIIGNQELQNNSISYKDWDINRKFRGEIKKHKSDVYENST